MKSLFSLDECPPCFDCHLTSFQCQHNATCSDANGKCDCAVHGLGGDACETPLCNSLAVPHERRHAKPNDAKYCSCDEGWSGNTCNVCMNDQVCAPLVQDGDGGTNSRCYTSTTPVLENHMFCKVTNEGVVRNLKRPAEVTFTCNKETASCNFQFWVEGSESFYCGMSKCAFTRKEAHDRNSSVVACEHLDCKCLPGKILCGEPGSIDLSDWMKDPDEGPTGPATVTCEEGYAGAMNHSCRLQEPHMTTLVRLISKEDYFALSCDAGQCLHYTQIPGYTRPGLKNAFSPLVIGILMATGLGLALAIFGAIFFLQNRRESLENVNSVGAIALPDETDEDIALARDERAAHGRALMAGHVPCSVGFLDVGYSLSPTSLRAQFRQSRMFGGFLQYFGRRRRAVELIDDDDRSSLLGNSDSGRNENGDSSNNAIRSSGTILTGIHGSIQPGQILAIMGGSGAGKTTFLDILAQRNKTGTVHGKILINGKPMASDEYKRITGYVDQEDALMPTQTVYEAILHSALLRLPRAMTYAAKLKRVHETMLELDILGIAHHRIGNSFGGTGRGISGGEKRRVSIACELVTSPSILFLDEPTSGLDAYNAHNVVECLSQLAKVYHRTVVFTIHQPRSDIFSLFDQLILIAKGRLVYSGPAEEAIDHFAAMGYPVPLGFNVADYLIDLTMHALDDPTEEEAISILTGNAEPGGDVPSDIITETPTRVTAHNVFDQFAAPPSDSESPIRASLSRPIPVSNADEFPNWGSTSPDRATGVQIPTNFEGAAEVWSSRDVTDNLSASPNRVSESGLRHRASQPPALVFATENVGLGRNTLLRNDSSSRRAGQSQRQIPHLMKNVSLQRLVTEYSKSLILSKIRYEVMESAASASADDVSSSSPADGQSTQGLRRTRSVSSFVSLNTTSVIRAADGKKRATGFQQFMILNSRTFKNLYRNPALLATHYMISLCVAAICSGLFWKVNDDIGGFQNRMGLFFFVCALFGFSAISGMQVFSAERPIFVRERANGYYRPITYYTSKILFEFLPLRIIPPLIFGLICYHMIGLRSEEVSFFLKFLLVLVLFNLTASACCMMLAIMFRNGSQATLLATLLMLFEMLFGGLLLNRGTVPPWANWLQVLSFFNAAMEALIVNEVDGLTLYETKYGLSIDVPGAVILQTFGFDARAFWKDVIVLAGMNVGFLVLGGLWLQLFVRERK
ncbi:hypothetical protein CcCBS67573_g07015 [Chytriomyces confervae]|uniref:ABC transporter domain-containing protein n=1 Tax=Chytriomyces confervae TaxID=246404 RepID=A0A507EZY2_9FUNG|nr:hypothetical protein CcCBS67573_g07015 [Chytriomyces confervae]